MTYTKEQTDRAAAQSVLEVAKKYFGEDIKRVGREAYRIEGHGFGGVEIDNNKNAYYHFAEQKGGVGALHFLMNFMKHDFYQAMNELGEYGTTVDFKPSHSSFSSDEKKNFFEPKHNENNSRVYAYMCKTRKISPQVVNRMIKAGLLYQDKYGNATFLHKDEQGKTIGAELTGTATDVRFKKNYGTGCLDYNGSENPTTAFVFESGIDMMSYMTLHPEHMNAKFISMAGLKHSYIDTLAEKNPNMTICLCVDNDEAGKKFAKDLSESFHKNGRQNKVLASSELRKNGVKDFNDLLKQKLTAENNRDEASIKQMFSKEER
jgi:5S rRNA maturation endonuclease (ribonuclease M5)